MSIAATLPVIAYATGQAGASMGFRLADSTGTFLYVDRIAEIRFRPSGVQESTRAGGRQNLQIATLMNDQFRQMGLDFRVSIDTQSQASQVTVQSINTGATVRTMDFSELLKIGQTLGMRPNTLVSQWA